MKEILKKQSVPFTQISNELLNDKEISAKAKGIYSFMFCKPPGWNFTIKSMAKQLLEGSRSISGALTELRDKGWVSYTKNQDGSGEYVLHIKPKPQNVDLENPQNYETATCGNRNEAKRNPISNNDLFSNIDLISNKEKSGKQNLPPSSKKEVNFSPEVLNCFNDCIAFFEPHLRPKNINTWISEIEKLNRVDKIPFETITEIVKWAREDSFWSSNFLSLLKLRKTNKDGVKYIIVFNEGMNKNKPAKVSREDLIKSQQEAKTFLNL